MSRILKSRHGLSQHVTTPPIFDDKTWFYFVAQEQDLLKTGYLLADPVARHIPIKSTPILLPAVWRCSRDVLLVVKGVLYLVDLWLVETGLEHDEPGVPKDIR